MVYIMVVCISRYLGRRYQSHIVVAVVVVVKLEEWDEKREKIRSIVKDMR